MASVPSRRLSGAELAAVRSRAAALAPRRTHSLWGDVWRRFKRHRLAVAGAVTFLVMTAATIIGPFIYTVGINTIDFQAALAAPSWVHPLGTNSLGQDELARILYGGRISIAVGITAMLVSVVAGTLVGAIAGYFGGITDTILMRLTDVFISLPSLPLLLLVIYLFRDSITAALGQQLGIFWLIVIVIGGLRWMPTARLVYAGFQSVKRKEYIDAARATGVGAISQIFRHILPNVLSPVIVSATLSVGAAIITESTLSFLGLGFPPDIPTWGRLLYDAQNYLDIAPSNAILPGLMICLAVLSVNYVGDGLRDALDPTRVV